MANKSELHKEEISMKEIILKIRIILIFLLGRWKLVVAFAVIGIICGFGYGWNIKPLYRAELTYVLEGESSSGYASVASQFGLDLGGNGSNIFKESNLLSLMKSRAIIQKALLTEVEYNGKKMSLADVFIEVHQLRKTWENEDFKKVSFSDNQDPKDFTTNQNIVLNQIYNIIIGKLLTVGEAQKKTGLSSIQMSSEDEVFSKAFVEALATKVSEFYVTTKTLKSAENIAILQHQADSIRGVLNASIVGVASRIDANPNQNPALQILRTPSQRKQIDVQTNQAMLGQIVQNLELAKISLRKEKPLMQIVDAPMFPLPIEKPNVLLLCFAGGFMGLFLIIGFLLLQFVYKNIMEND